MLAHAPSLARTSSAPFSQPDRVSDERALAQIRSQVAIVLTLTDQLARIAHSDDAEGLCQQLLEEVTRLRERITAIARSSSNSGVFPVHTVSPR
jgi:hypothetical protein